MEFIAVYAEKKIAISTQADKVAADLRGDDPDEFLRRPAFSLRNVLKTVNPPFTSFHAWMAVADAFHCWKRNTSSESAERPVPAPKLFFNDLPSPVASGYAINAGAAFQRVEELKCTYHQPSSQSDDDGMILGMTLFNYPQSEMAKRNDLLLLRRIHTAARQ
jgi:hypothetical protein